MKFSLVPTYVSTLPRGPALPLSHREDPSLCSHVSAIFCHKWSNVTKTIRACFIFALSMFCLPYLVGKHHGGGQVGSGVVRRRDGGEKLHFAAACRSFTPAVSPLNPVPPVARDPYRTARQVSCLQFTRSVERSRAGRQVGDKEKCVNNNNATTTTTAPAAVRLSKANGLPAR